MKIFNYFTFLFACLFSFLSAIDELPKYKMIDLGVFGTDQSQALAINEKGQVLGLCTESINQYLFLWDKNKGLTIIELPKDGYWSSFKLNDNGQIVGRCESKFGSKLIYWDVNSGFWEIESSSDEDGIGLIAFNDMGQVLGDIENTIIIWDHGKKINLTTLFKEKVPGKWYGIRATALNNRGHVALTAHKQAENPQDQNTGEKSFIWKDGSFSMILSEIGWETSIQVEYMDDDNNMIVNCYPQKGGGHSRFFVNQSKRLFVPCPECNIIKNGVPISRGCLPGLMKKDRHGNAYFSKGIEIKKLLSDEFPYYNISNTAGIHDQNSKGYVVGTVETMYSYHAFLAIPKK